MLQTVLCGAACAAAAYLLGSLSFSIIVTRLLYHKDIRTFGSGNAGMTNVLRTFGKGAAALTIVGDIGKGILAVLLAKWAFGAFTAADPIYGAYIAAFCAVLGHVYPVYFGFKGGKAVATSIGVLIPLAFWQLLIAVCICLFLIWRSGFVSLGSLALVTAMPILLALSGKFGLLPLSLIILALVFWSHRENIRRLAKGEEKTWIKK